MSFRSHSTGVTPLLLVLILALIAPRGFAEIAIETLTGLKLTDVTVKESGEDFVVLGHSGGEARLALAELSKETRDQLGLQPTLASAKADFQRALEEQRSYLNELDALYEGYLMDLEEEATRKGDLESVLAAKAERGSFRTGSGFEASNPVKVQKLRQIFEKEKLARQKKVTAKMSSILVSYLNELGQIQKRLTKGNHIESALLVREEAERIEKIRSAGSSAVIALVGPELALSPEEEQEADKTESEKTGAEMAQDPIVDRITKRNSHWAWGTGGTFTITRNGRIMHSRWGDSQGTWERTTDSTLSAIDPSGKRLTITFQDESSGTVKYEFAGGSTTLTRSD